MGQLNFRGHSAPEFRGFARVKPQVGKGWERGHRFPVAAHLLHVVQGELGHELKAINVRGLPPNGIRELVRDLGCRHEDQPLHSSHLGNGGQFSGDFVRTAILPNLVRQKQLAARPALAGFKGPVTKPQKRGVLLSLEHDMRVENDPAGRQGPFHVPSRGHRPPFEPVGHLAGRVKDEPTHRRLRGVREHLGSFAPAGQANVVAAFKFCAVVTHYLRRFFGTKSLIHPFPKHRKHGSNERCG